MKKLLFAFVVIFLLSGCVGYAPTVKLIPGKMEPWEIASANDKNGKRADVVEMKGIPSARRKLEIFSLYLPPPLYMKSKVEDWHYWNFVVTSEFEKAMAAYLAGQWKEQLVQCDAILSNDKNHPNLLWRASVLRVNALIMLKKYDLAEAETARTEKLEIAAMGKNANQTSRALRAEVKFWAGDTEGAIADAASVLNSFDKKEWRFPTFYLFGPPRDQAELARCTTAQARANIILGLAFIQKGQTEEALSRLGLADQTTSDVFFVARHPEWGVFFWPPEEMFWERGVSLAALGVGLLAFNKEPERAAKMFARAQDYFKAIGYERGPDLINALKAKTLAQK